LIKTVHDKNKEINTLKLKLKDEEFINRKNRIFENSSVIAGVHNITNNSSNNNIHAVRRNLNAAGVGNNYAALNDINLMDRSLIINQIGEVEYFKSLNSSLQEQIKG